MPKINIGGSFDSSRLNLEAEFSSNSDIEINVGDGHDMSQRQIKLLERDAATTSGEIEKLRQLVAQLQAQAPHDAKVAALGSEAVAIADVASRIQRERKWYSVTTKGLIEAAEAVGSVASPIVKTALSVMKLLSDTKLTT